MEREIWEQQQKKIKQNKVYCICVLFLATSISTAKHTHAYNHTEYPESHNIEWGDEKWSIYKNKGKLLPLSNIPLNLEKSKKKENKNMQSKIQSKRQH